MKKTGLFLIIILLANTFSLLSNKPDKAAVEFDYNYIKVNQYMGILVNVDAFTFIGVAIQPSYLFQPEYLRQSRPAYAIIGSAIGYLIYYSTYPLHGFLENKLKKGLALKGSETEKNKGMLYFSFYIGYVFLNLLILIVTLWIFDKLIYLVSGHWKNGKLLYIFALLMLVANHETKYFFWTPHQQLFNILTPVLSIYAGLKINQDDIPPSKLFFISFLTGLSFLIYGNFILLFATLLSTSVYNHFKRRQLKYGTILVQLAAMMLLFSLPTLCWILILKAKGVDFTSSEISVYRQFVWIIDSAKMSPQVLFYHASTYTWLFLQTFGSILLPSILPAATGLYLFIKKLPLPALKQKAVAIPGLILVSYAVFFWLLGYYADRLTFSLVPFIIYYFTLMVNQQKVENYFKYILIFLICLSIAWVFLFDAPYFSQRLFLN